jgi:hypothetical protein
MGMCVKVLLLHDVVLGVYTTIGAVLLAELLVFVFRAFFQDKCIAWAFVGYIRNDCNDLSIG